MRILILLLFCAAQMSAQYSISGSVKNDIGEPLIGASVFLHGTDYATITNDQGNFKLESIEENLYRFKVTYVGYASHTEELYVDEDFKNVDIVLSGSPFQLENIEITANALNDKSSFTYSEMNNEQVAFKNLGQDLPYLLEHTPSTVVTSDAGAGIGYTYMRIRGSDATRVNVTINGVPLNDSESHQVFWVDLPDFSSSVDNIQIQRGVGPSTNGSGAFGASVSLNTNKVHINPYVTLSGGYGSFNTRKVSARIGTGLINNSFTIDGRYSIIKSDGYIDRATSDLTSWSFSVAKLGENHSLRFNVFSGDERTYQAWNGVPEEKLFGTQEELLTHYQCNPNGDYNTVEDSLNLFNSDRRYNVYTYEDEVDDYEQDHYQLIYNQGMSDNFSLNTTLHYTRGVGFFETFTFNDSLNQYFEESIVDTFGVELATADLVRRRWLDNHFYGIIMNGDYSISDNSNIIIGGAYNIYEGEHYGRVPFIENVREFNFLRRYYDNKGTKKDANVYAKWNHAINNNLSIFTDLQYRTVSYTVDGDDEGVPVSIDEDFSFFNPKFGITYEMSPTSTFYASYARGQREPIRNDLIGAITAEAPRPEVLDDIEIGWRGRGSKWSMESNLYVMLYKDQLVPTGGLNDVGAILRTNVDKSRRIGIELSLAYQVMDKLTWSPNLTLSQNRIDEYAEFVYPETIDYQDTDIAFSPSVIGGSQLTYALNDNFRVDWLSKYVGKQYLDNTSSDDRKINPFWVNDLVLTYDIPADFIQNGHIKLALNNFLNHEYESNGYTFSWIDEDGNRKTNNYLSPQAGINFLLGMEVTF